MANEPGSHRKVYAKGYYDGLRAYGISTDEVIKGEAMNQARMNSIVNNLSGVASKVLASVPTKQAANKQQISIQLNRTSHNMDARTMEGCLNTLVNAKLVTEPIRGYFIRAAVKEKETNDDLSTFKIKEKPQMTVVKPKPVTQSIPVNTETSPLDLFGNFGNRINAIVKTLQQLAQDVDAAALQVDEQLEVSKQKNEKLNQLQALLKSLQ